MDGRVDLADLYEVAMQWNTSVSGSSTIVRWFKGDFNNSGAVDAGDLGILAARWQFGVVDPDLDYGDALDMFWP